MTCEECSRIPAFMHSKTGRFLCRSCIYKDGSGQLQDSDLFEQPELPELENLGGCEFVKPRMNMKTGDSK